MSSFLGAGVVKLTAKSIKKLFGMMELFYILIEMAVTEVNRSVKTNHTVDFKYVHFIYINYTSTLF